MMAAAARLNDEGRDLPRTEWRSALSAWVGDSPTVVRVLARAGIPVDLDAVPGLGGAEILLEAAVPRGGWMPVDADPPAPALPLQAVVCVGSASARDMLSVFGRAYRWLAPGGRLLLVDHFSGPRASHGFDGCQVLASVTALAGRAGFVREAELDVDPGWPAPSAPGVAIRGKLLVFRRGSDVQRWRVTHQESARLEQTRALFRKVFGHEMSPHLWQWKYGHGRGQGALAVESDRVVAHYGVLTRRVRLFGSEARAAQVVDVMVDPTERGVLTRKGPFFLAAASMPEACSGFGSKHIIGFGFPNHRHHRLAEHLGLYREVERITQLTWTALPGDASRWVVEDLARFAPPRAERVVDRLWTAMAGDLRDMIVGERDFGWMRYRYLDHPEHRYHLLAVRGRWSLRPLGVAVLRTHGASVELMDVVGPLRKMRDVVRAMRHQASLLGGNELFCWITRGKVGWLGPEEATETDPDVCIPTSVHTPGPDPRELRERWWLMSGDTDFR